MMANQQSYHWNGNRHDYYQSLPKSSTDHRQMYPILKDMGPPSLDFPPRPMEIDLTLSRTLPSPSSSGVAPWESNFIQSQGLGDVSYAPSQAPRMPPIASHMRGSPQDALASWYNINDGPWVPQTAIPELVPGDRVPPKHINFHNLTSYGNQYRQPNPSEAGSFHYGVSHSDSGYGTRRSVGNTSVFSGDVPERDQDSQSLTGHMSEFQSFQGVNEVMQHESRMNESWNPTALNSSSLVCSTCQSQVKTQSELKKHKLRHTKPFVCQITGCKRTEGFSTINDLERHTKSKHPSTDIDSSSTKRYQCHVSGCKSRDKTWPRLDNFRSHLKRVHGSQLSTDALFADMVQRAEVWGTANLNSDQELPPVLDMPMSESSDANDPWKNKKFELNWKPLHPDTHEPYHDMTVPRVVIFENQTGNLPDERPPLLLSDLSHTETIQPAATLKVQPSGTMHENKCSVNNFLISQVGDCDILTPQMQNLSAPKPSVENKVVNQTSVSAADAILEVIKSVSSGPSSPEDSADRSDLERLRLPSEKVSPQHLLSASLSFAGTSARDSSSATGSGTSLLSEETSINSEAQSKINEALRILKECGYTLQKDPTPLPKAHNASLGTSSRSEGIVTCSMCKRFSGRPCELKKHMKRHERPYGCTFSACSKTFGSKNDWKRHENSQHIHLEKWRCDEQHPGSKDILARCSKVCYRRQAFHDHLRKGHAITCPEVLESKLKSCQIGINCQTRFWCGFCDKTIELTQDGIEASTERFNHIDDHFMGRHGLKKENILDWKPCEGDIMKKDIKSLSNNKESCNSDSGSGSGTLPDATGSSVGVKRTRSPMDGEESANPAKRHKTSLPGETGIYCFQCHLSDDPNLDLDCYNECDPSHVFCLNCDKGDETEL